MDDRQKLASEIRDVFDRLIFYQPRPLTNDELKQFRDFLTSLFPQPETSPLGVSAGDHQPTFDKFG